MKFSIKRSLLVAGIGFFFFLGFRTLFMGIMGWETNLAHSVIGSVIMALVFAFASNFARFRQ